MPIDLSFEFAALDVDAADVRPLLIVPYMWIGDFVRVQTVVRILRHRWPNRPVDVLAARLPSTLARYMPGVRKAVVCDLPRGRVAFGDHRALARRLRAERYATALVMPRTFKSALAPALARIPERIGFWGEARLGLLTDRRRGEKTLPRMIDRMAALALPVKLMGRADWPPPQLAVPNGELDEWRHVHGLEGRSAVVLAPGSVGPSKRWTAYPDLARELAARGFDVWVVGGPGERDIAGAIVGAGGARVRDLTGHDLRDAVRALACARLAVANDSGLLHVAAALGTPSIGIFGPTSPALWKPLNDLAETLSCGTKLACQPCHKPVCIANHHRCMRDISAARVAESAERSLAETEPMPAA